ncbi:MAG: hypothetical protein ABIT69_05150 [Sphingomicrobium sp.]
MKRIAPLLAAVLALGACTTFANNFPNGPLVDGGPVRADGMARLGEPTRVGMLVATPQVLVEDSRCPMNARCVWAGRVVVTTRIDSPGWRETANLTLGQPYATHGTALALTSAEPNKMAGAAATPPSAYLFGFQPR